MITRRHNGEQCLLYEDSYGSNIEHVLHLFRIAQRDFPDLRYADVGVVRLEGQSNKGVTAIHWHGKRLTTYHVVKCFND